MTNITEVDELTEMFELAINKSDPVFILKYRIR